MVVVFAKYSVDAYDERYAVRNKQDLQRSLKHVRS